MAFARNLWGDVFARDSIPKFRCPRCEGGHLHFVKDSLVLKQPRYSVLLMAREESEPDWATERFIFLLRCDVRDCGEFVTVAGDTTVVESEDEEYGSVLLTVLRPRTLFPAPPIIQLPDDVPAEVTENVILSHQLYWADLAACASRLRVSVENLLDHFKISREIVGKDGKLGRLDLNARIALFAKTDKENADTLTALRMIGNLGAHGTDVNREALLDAYEIYEDCLAELCGQRKARLKALKEKIIKTKGKY